MTSIGTPPIAPFEQGVRWGGVAWMTVRNRAMVSLVLGFMLPVILEQAKSWAQIVRKSLVIATILVAARGAFGVCRRLWPTTAIRST